MTKTEFKEKFKEGVNINMVIFLKTLRTVMTSDEIDKIIAYTPRLRERIWLKRFKKFYLANYTDSDAPFWLTLREIKSVELLKDVIGLMTLANKNVYHGESEKDDTAKHVTVKKHKKAK